MKLLMKDFLLFHGILKAKKEKGKEAKGEKAPRGRKAKQAAAASSDSGGLSLFTFRAVHTARGISKTCLRTPLESSRF